MAKPEPAIVNLESPFLGRPALFHELQQVGNRLFVTPAGLVRELPRPLAELRGHAFRLLQGTPQLGQRRGKLGEVRLRHFPGASVLKLRGPRPRPHGRQSLRRLGWHLFGGHDSNSHDFDTPGWFAIFAAAVRGDRRIGDLGENIVAFDQPAEGRVFAV
jgi:hypothetical protein